MSGRNTCGKNKCKGWTSEVEDMDTNSNKPLGVYCRCGHTYRKCVLCDKYPSFGFEGTKCMLTCKTHTNNKMINVACRRFSEKIA